MLIIEKEKHIKIMKFHCIWNQEIDGCGNFSIMNKIRLSGIIIYLVFIIIMLILLIKFINIKDKYININNITINYFSYSILTYIIINLLQTIYLIILYKNINVGITFIIFIQTIPWIVFSILIFLCINTFLIIQSDKILLNNKIIVIIIWVIINFTTIVLAFIYKIYNNTIGLILILRGFEWIIYFCLFYYCINVYIGKKYNEDTLKKINIIKATIYSTVFWLLIIGSLWISQGLNVIYNFYSYNDIILYVISTYWYYGCFILTQIIFITTFLQNQIYNINSKNNNIIKV